MQKQETNFRKIKSQKKVLVIGSAVIDVIVNIPKLPASGEDVFSSSQEVIVGGCAYNVGNILQQLNASYDLMIPIGNGPNAAQISKQMKSDNHSQMLNDLDGDNGWCFSMVEDSGERTFLTVPGIENNWQEEWFEKINFLIYDYIYLSGYSFEGNSAKVLLNQLQNKNKETTIIFDPSPRVSAMDKGDLKTLLEMDTIIHCNRDELLSLCEQTDIETGAKMIHQKTHKPVVVTLGSEGTLFVADNKIKICRGKEVPLVDTIGAGDAHTGAFIAALLDEQSIETACMWGNEAASKVVQVQGGNVTLF
ncbi:PfkB family carbohydrate kinase [Shouchella clausii]|uniref:PfkB family carbohydrate kinase n=1 Tax=Shouchella clausii TaxID=79880 RepID=UPI002705B997|nr:PfkB family carbohydrate kinase [Shouchella clausii]MDO7267538.1 PfkB family carbohydrate kinase [Shouchella clausii]MDO7287508.1 PfkB family carbohydrate kinase [Shouchella clausii]